MTFSFLKKKLDIYTQKDEKQGMWGNLGRGMSYRKLENIVWCGMKCRQYNYYVVE